MTNPRTTATQVLQRILWQKKSLTEVLPECLARHKHMQEHPLIQEICYGVLRYYEALEILVTKLVNKPLKKKDNDVHTLLLVGLYQLLQLNIAPHAAVMETVNAAQELGKSWAKQLVNAVLRNYLRQQTQLKVELAEIPRARYHHPDWLLSKFQQDWPDDWQAIAMANYQRPPMSLRVNRQKITRQAYLEKLANKAINAEACLFVPEGILLSKPLEVSMLPEFFAGEVSVQDGAAMLAAGLMDLAPGLHVLDACSAPGGKLCHLLEMEPGIHATALDISNERINKIHENIQRLQLRVPTVISADATQLPSWWDGILFDRILLDAPCSATGVIKRHPDIKLRRQAEDITLFAAQQLQLLNNLWSLLKPNGILLYATCSILRQENEQVIAQFLQIQQHAQEIPIVANWGRRVTHGRQILPQDEHMDGFYYAKLTKLSESV